MKYSIVVPVYNAEKYLEECLDSLVNQTYDNFEIIIVNDGSTDSSKDIIKKYEEKYKDKIKSYYKENSGNVAIPRNYAIKYVSGDYMLFVDSDDYIDINALEVINANNLNGKADVISFSGICVNPDGVYLSDFAETEFKEKNGEDSLESFINKVPCFEIACRYAYKTSYFKKNKFEYARRHEDFGMTPIIVARARKVVSILDKFYFYRQSDSSITRHDNYEKKKEMAYDMLYHFDVLYKEFNEGSYSNNLKKIFNSYIANAMLRQYGLLRKKDRRSFLVELDKRNVRDMLASDTFVRKVKKALVKISIDLYIKL